jgi:hypothetical protein
MNILLLIYNGSKDQVEHQVEHFLNVNSDNGGERLLRWGKLMGISKHLRVTNEFCHFRAPLYNTTLPKIWSTCYHRVHGTVSCSGEPQRNKS